MSPRAGLFDSALSLFQEQKFQAAERQLSKLLRDQPRHVGALNVMALLLTQTGRAAQAEKYFLEAVRLFPASDATYYNYGVALNSLGRLLEARDMFGRALSINAMSSDTWNYHGVVLTNLGDFGSALADFDRALVLNPNAAAAWANKGRALCELGRHEEACVAYERATALQPDAAEAWLGQAVACRGLRRSDQAIVAYDRALALQPDLIDAWLGRGRLLQDLERYGEAVAAYDRVIKSKPDCAEAWVGRGDSLMRLEQYDHAEGACDRALELNPGLPAATIVRGNLLMARHRPVEALACYEQVIAAGFRGSNAYVGRGHALALLNRNKEALDSYEQALAMEPDFPTALLGMGNVMRDLGRVDEAIATYNRGIANHASHAGLLANRGIALARKRHVDAAIADFERALRKNPDDPIALDGLANALLEICDWDNAEAPLGKLLHLIDSDRAGGPLFIRVRDDPLMHRRCAAAWIRAFGLSSFERDFRSLGASDKIHVAYLSADFRQHPVGVQLAGLIERHDRIRFEVTAISFGTDDGSETRARLVKAFDRFEDVAGKGDHEVAQLLRDLKVHVAVDLMGLTLGARHRIFANRPAPIAVSFLGHPGTTGANFIDYVMADPVVLPGDQQQYYSERIVHLPDCFFPPDPNRPTSPQVPSRCEAGLPERGFVFCCFNNSYKITAPVFGTWMRLLAQVDGSVLWLSQTNERAVVNLRAAARVRGIDPERLVFASRVPSMAGHLSRYRLADLFLDTLPYNAHATANDALWAGVPVLTCAGIAFAGRVAASMLHAVGLPELVTHSLEEYEALAKKLATEPDSLRPLRRRLDENRQNSPLFDLDRYRHHIETAYATMWDRWRRGEGPLAFSVAAAESGISLH